MPRVYKSPITSRVFELVARVIKDIYVYDKQEFNGGSDYVLVEFKHSLAQRFAEEFSRTNPRFDRIRFYHACGLGE